MKEKRTVRKQILFTRSMNEKTKEFCKTNKISFNELVNIAVEIYMLNRRF